MPTASEMDDTIFHRMPPATRLRVTGSDAATFLQGQFSNELRRPQARPATYGLWLNHKGRVLADSHVLQRGAAEFEVVSLTSPAAAIRERLESYIIADDVSLEDAGAGGDGLVIAGARAGEALRALDLEVPASRQFAEAGKLLALPARVEATPAWLVVGPEVAIAAAVTACESLAVRPVDRVTLDRRRVAAGLPAVPAELGPDDLPMEGGLEADALSFTKGCYLGQEVMSRLHNLGQVRRRLFIVALDADAGAPARAVALFSGSQKVGELRAAIAGGEHGGALGLAMLQTHAVQPGAALSLQVAGPACVRVERLAEGRAP